MDEPKVLVTSLRSPRSCSTGSLVQVSLGSACGTVTSAHASHLLASKYPVMHGIMVPLVHRLRGNTTMHIEVRPVEGSRRKPTFRQAR
jgi:hypothetical protein